MKFFVEVVGGTEEKPDPDNLLAAFPIDAPNLLAAKTIGRDAYLHGTEESGRPEWFYVKVTPLNEG